MARRQFHYVWLGRSFPYVNLLAIRSLRAAEPDATINVHIVGEIPDSDHLRTALDEEAVVIRCVDIRRLLEEIDRDFPGVVDFYESLPENALAARSNVIRYAVLWNSGGIYLDFDTVVLSGFGHLAVHKAFVGEEVVWKGNVRHVAGDSRVYFEPATWSWAASWVVRRLDSALAAGRFGLAGDRKGGDAVWMRRQVNNAVIGAPRHSPFIARLLERVPACSPDVRFSTGPTLIDEVARAMPDDVVIHPAEVFYSVAPGESYRLLEDSTLRLPAAATVVHWVSSNHPRLVAGSRPGEWPGVRRGSVLAGLFRDLEEGFRPGVAVATEHQMIRLAVGT